MTMQPIILTTVVDEKRRVMIDLPADVPLGEVQLEVTVRPVSSGAADQPPDPITREWVRAKLIAAGHQSNNGHSPDALDVSEDERQRLSRVFSSDRPLSELINEDREERF